ncbi:SDR family oxidoreductase [Lipingzhangella sp. LS1_29]|uniref:SDR family oxidoreductase n=1 Tax=Lipingzhangella rawalii TaxID=2055835 RepID=A0ABU2H1G8_9ACTN|nr:SDR family oxidoreductase [Lipingzhangella rawalii]MDS1269155.1 SDR family oxidoreductase [Lipingzhangella rawalii]
MNRFGGRVAIVTGASRGIGRAIAQRILEEGGSVTITARSEEPLYQTAAELGGEDRVLAVPGKAHDSDHQQDAVHRAIDAFGRVDILVNNTGINPVLAPVLDVEPAAMAKVYEVNVIAAHQWVRTVHQAWMAEHGGVVVNIASIAGQFPSPGISAYGVTKAALINLTQQLAFELAPGIRVNAVAPAVVKTRFAEALYTDNEDQVAAGYPLRRLGTPEDVAGTVAFLASPDAEWMTGQVLTLDGGVTLGGGLG